MAGASSEAAAPVPFSLPGAGAEERVEVPAWPRTHRLRTRRWQGGSTICIYTGIFKAQDGWEAKESISQVGGRGVIFIYYWIRSLNLVLKNEEETGQGGEGKSRPGVTALQSPAPDAPGESLVAASLRPCHAVSLAFPSPGWGGRRGQGPGRTLARVPGGRIPAARHAAAGAGVCCGAKCSCSAHGKAKPSSCCQCPGLLHTGIQRARCPRLRASPPSIPTHLPSSTLGLGALAWVHGCFPRSRTCSSSSDAGFFGGGQGLLLCWWLIKRIIQSH